jgi:hypothetical protein
MMAITRDRMTVALALVILTVGLADSTAGASLGFDRSAAGWVMALGVLVVTATIAANTIRRPHPLLVTRRIPENLGRPVTTPSYVVDVSRPSTPWSWRAVLLAPFELLVVAWSVPVLILLLAAPIGLAIAALLWLGRLMVRSS